jgi:hypothetical protein
MYYYFCAYPHTFDKGCQVVSVDKGAGSLRKTAALWKKTNGYKNVYVYDMNHNFVWNF